MTEFGDRISAQRKILDLVNGIDWIKEDLFGLSSKAIDRWWSVNGIDRQDPLVVHLVEISCKLLFLANQSQLHVTDEHHAISLDIDNSCRELNKALSKFKK